MLTFRVLFWFCAMVLCTVAANLFLKAGASEPEPRLWVLGMAGSKTLLGVLCFGASLLLYMGVLKLIPLNIAQCLSVVQFVGVILASVLVLNENIPPLRWLGVVVIMSGVLLVAYTAQEGGS